MTRDELITLRKRLDLTQAEMAKAIGLSGRAYGAIETGESELRDLHTLAIERAALAIAVARNDPMLAPASVRRDALALVRAFEGRDDVVPILNSPP